MKTDILIVAGGTGGHIWPAVSFGSWVQANKNKSVEYVCGCRPLELEIYKSAGINPIVLPMDGSPFSGSTVLVRVKRVMCLIKSIILSYFLIKKYSPKCCVMFAGYISFPLLFVCKMTGVKAVLHEQNAYAGKVTRIAGKLKVKILTGWSKCRPLCDQSYEYVGVPIRNFDLKDRAAAWKAMVLPLSCESEMNVVVMTGSLGSLAIKDLVCKAALRDEFKKCFFILPAVSEKCEIIGSNVFLLPKVWDASLLFSIADAMVVRAGGSTLTEAGNLGIKSIVIPWRKAADDHQYYNAMIFASENNAEVFLEDEDDEKFIDILRNLKENCQRSNSNITGRLYNSSGKICENFWLALSPYFERSACSDTGQ